jgi:hypothetical protein
MNNNIFDTSDLKKPESIVVAAVTTQEPKKNRLALWVIASFGILVLAGLGGLVGSKLSKDKPIAKSLDTVAVESPTAATDQPTTSVSPGTVAKKDCGVIAVDYTCYRDLENRIQFAYPTEWGTVVVKVDKPSESHKGTELLYKFIDNPRPKVGLRSIDYAVIYGRDYADCLDDATIFYSAANKSAPTTIGETRYPSGEYLYTIQLKDNTNAKMYSYFETKTTGEVGLGACPGLRVVGDNIFVDQSKYLGAQLSWSRRTIGNFPIVTKAQYDEYVANPKAQLDDQAIETLSTFLSSVEPI